MRNESRRNLLRSLVIAPVAGALASSAAAQSGAVYGGFTVAPPQSKYLNRPTPEMLLKMGSHAREQLRVKHFPDVVLTNQDGQQFRYYTDLLKDKVVALNFFYTKCEGICPGVTANLTKVYKILGDRMGKQIFMYSITLKPEQDTPEVLKEYARTFNAGPGRMFLTGNYDNIEQVRRGMGFVNSDPVLDKDKSQHIGNICYGNESHMLWGIGPGLVNATWLAHEISSVVGPDVKRS